jgi:ABC-type nitrate/sulfonate/bicarbonate transport system permease component
LGEHLAARLRRDGHAVRTVRVRDLPAAALLVVWQVASGTRAVSNQKLPPLNVMLYAFVGMAMGTEVRRGEFVAPPGRHTVGTTVL